MRSAAAFAAFVAAMFPGVHSVADDVPKPLPPTPETQIQASPEFQQTQAPELTRADAEAWLDGFMNFALPRGDVAGGVVVIVKDGEVLLQKGYGYADAATRKPVDPQLTLFRPGSVSKLFTWTALMQMVEQGKVDLDADVNEYLDFRIPERDGKPVTLRNILTHTAGFEEQVKGLMGVGGEPVGLDAHLKRWTPERIFAPGETPAYSNYATALAGYVVAQVSGQSFDDYLDEHLFAPLGMENSTFRQPLPERLRPQMSNGYAVSSQPPKPFEIVGPAPAGSLSASGADMARFMIAHLQKGAYGSSRILKPETAEQMHTTALTILPRVNRMMLGFYETNYNGRRVIGHGGDTQWFHSYLHLFLDDGIGLFMSFNSTGKDGAVSGIRSALFEQFADRYLPGPRTESEAEVDAKTAAEHARMIVGRYSNSRRMDSNFMSLLNLIGEAKVTANEDGTISMSMMQNLAGESQKLKEIAPFVWRDVNGQARLSADVENGRVLRFSFDDVSPFMMFEPTPAWKSGGWLLPAFVMGLIALLLTSLAWPVTALIRRHYGATYPLSGQDAQAHRLLRIGAVAVFAVSLAWGITITTMMSDFNLLSGDLDGWLWVLQTLSLFVFFGAAGAAAWNAWVVLRSQRGWFARLWAVVLALSCLATLWVALIHDLIAFDTNY